MFLSHGRSSLPAKMCRVAPLKSIRNRWAATCIWNRPRFSAVLLMLFIWAGLASAKEDGAIPTKFKVKFVTAGAVYLEGGREDGLSEGQRLTVLREGLDASGKPMRGMAEILIISVASTSSAGEILNSDLEIRAGDTAFLSAADIEKLKLQKSARDSRKYPQVITFTEGDPMDEEVREYIPRPKLPEINRTRGRIGVDYSSIQEPPPGVKSAQVGIVLRADMTRIGGSYWNLSGYYRGRLNSRSGGDGPATLNDLVNRTYHLNLTYNNPGSKWVAGFGRFYLPYASSLSTIDGGYVGRKVGRNTTVGVFGGSAPDPTAWSYDPHRQIAGGFASFEGGSFESLRYSSTFGLALSRINWHPDRQFAFFENGIFYKRYLSVYHNMEVDQLHNSSAPDRGIALSRDYLTVRLQPHRIISFDVSENYFRDVPTFDTRLISTGLVDKLLFQGLSGGVRLELPYHVGVYSTLGKSHRTGDERSSLNQMYGITFGQIWRTGLKADARYSKFDSSFGRGTYESVMFSRALGENLRIDFQAGQQDFTSPLTNESRTRWITSNFDWFVGRHYFLGSGLTIYRGRIQNYDQWFLNLGYRF